MFPFLIGYPAIQYRDCTANVEVTSPPAGGRRHFGIVLRFDKNDINASAGLSGDAWLSQRYLSKSRIPESTLSSEVKYFK